VDHSLESPAVDDERAERKICFKTLLGLSIIRSWLNHTHATSSSSVSRVLSGWKFAFGIKACIALFANCAHSLRGQQHLAQQHRATVCDVTRYFRAMAGNDFDHVCGGLVT